MRIPKALAPLKPVRNATGLSYAMKLGPSPVPAWVSFLLAVVITISAFDDLRLVISGGDLSHRWVALAGTVGYWCVWMSLAFLPKFTAPFFILMLAAMLPQLSSGGPLLLALGAVAIAAYRVSIRSLGVIVGMFLIWQLVWVPFVAQLSPTQLWGYFPVTIILTVPGLTIKLMRERAIRLALERQRDEERAAKATQEQRMALARELHDVVTHGLTMIAVQANLGVISSEEDAQRHALTEVAAMARNSLEDLRRLLKTIRADDLAREGSPAAEPKIETNAACIDLSQSLADSQSRLNGLGCTTRVSTSGDLERTPNGLRSTVVRILQESATNVVKHSGSNSECEITLDVRGDHLQLVISSLMTPGKPRLPVSGSGLAGLRERASRLGGSLEAGPNGDWWVVRTVLPFKERQRVRL